MTAIKNGTLLVKDSNGNTARVATLSQTDITTLNTALTGIGTNSVSIQSLTNQVKTIQGRYVDVDTQQTITGKKTLTTTNKANVITVKVTNTDSTVTPTENLWTNVISVYDKNTKNAGNLQFSREPDGTNWVKLQAANQNTNGNNIYHVIGIGLKSDGTATTSAPNPASNSNDSSIATTSWVNDKVNPIKNNYVTTTTQQDISGFKVFTRAYNAVAFKHPTLDVSAAPSSNDEQFLQFTDKNSKNVGIFKTSHNTDNYNKIEITAIAQNSQGQDIYSVIAASLKPDGTPKT